MGFLGHNVAEKICVLTLTDIILFLRMHYLKIRLMFMLYAQQKVDTLKDEEEGSYNFTGTVEIQDVTETLEIHYQSTNLLEIRVILTHILQYLLK
jgi:hypothetical protein